MGKGGVHPQQQTLAQHPGVPCGQPDLGSQPCHEKGEGDRGGTTSGVCPGEVKTTCHRCLPNPKRLETKGDPNHISLLAHMYQAPITCNHPPRLFSDIVSLHLHHPLS